MERGARRQLLANNAVHKHFETYYKVKIDTENYRVRRKETLENLARNVAFKVKRTKHSVSLEPMNPFERRVIHSALQNDKFVTTHSEGDEPFRHIVVRKTVIEVKGCCNTLYFRMLIRKLVSATALFM